MLMPMVTEEMLIELARELKLLSTEWTGVSLRLEVGVRQSVGSGDALRWTPMQQTLRKQEQQKENEDVRSGEHSNAHA